MNPYAAAGHLIAVENQVIRPRPDFEWIFIQQGHIVHMDAGKRMMLRIKPFLLRVILKQWEIQLTRSLPISNMVAVPVLPIQRAFL